MRACRRSHYVATHGLQLAGCVYMVVDCILIMNILQGMLTLALTICAMTSRPCRGRPMRHHVNHKKLKEARIEAIKTDILTKLGFTGVPDVSRINTTISEKRKKIRLYKKSLEETQGKIHELFQEEEYFAKTFHSFTDQGSPPPGVMDEVWKRYRRQRFYFKLEIPQPKIANRELHLHSATLNLYKYRTWPENLRDSSNYDRTVSLSVYQLLVPLDCSYGKPMRRLVSTKVVSLLDVGWEAFDVKSAVKLWMDNPQQNYGLEIVCESQQISDIVDFSTVKSHMMNDIFGYSLAESLLPNLSVYVQEKEILGRVKRSPEVYDCVQGDGETRCCRYPLWVSFRDIAWDDWVVEPEGYQAYYCDGSCPHRYKPAHTFAGIKSAIHLVNPAAAPAPCCTGTKLSPLTLLHYDEWGLLKVTQYSDMVVQECKCA